MEAAGAPPSLFDRLAARDWGSGLDGYHTQHQQQEGGASGILAQQPAIRDYLPSVLRLLRDADNAQESSAGSKEFAPIVDKLMEIAMRYQTADAIEEYLCVASDVCKSRLKSYSSGSPIKTPAMTCTSSATTTTTSSSSQDAQGASSHKNTVLLFESGSAVARTKLVLDEILDMLAALKRNAWSANTKAGKEAAAPGETIDILNRTSFGQELKCLLPVLTAYAPSLSHREIAKGLVLHSKLSPIFLLTIVQNEPLALAAVLRGTAEAVVEAEGMGGREALILEHAEETCIKLAELSRTVALEVRSYLVSQRLLPGVCLDISRVMIRDVGLFVASLWGHDWFWDVVDMAAVLQALGVDVGDCDDEVGGQVADVAFDKAVVLAVSSLEDRVPWEQLRCLWARMQGLASSSMSMLRYRPVLPLLLLMAIYIEGLLDDDGQEGAEAAAHEATSTFVTTLVDMLRTGAAARWRTNQGCVPLYVALLLTASGGGPPRFEVLVDTILLPLIESRPPDIKNMTVLSQACQAAAASMKVEELSGAWLFSQLSSLPLPLWPAAPFDPLHCLVEAYEQGLPSRHGPLQLHDWLLGLLRTSPFPPSLASHPCLLPLLDHYANACVTDPSVQRPGPHELHALASPWSSASPCPLPPLTLSGLLNPLAHGGGGNKRRRRRGWCEAAGACSPPPGYHLLPFLNPTDEEYEGEEDTDLATGGSEVPPPPSSPAPAMLACLLALRLHRLYFSTQAAFDDPLDWDLPSLPLRRLLHDGSSCRSLHVRLMCEAVDAFPDMFQSGHLLKEEDSQKGHQRGGVDLLQQRSPSYPSSSPFASFLSPAASFEARAKEVLSSLSHLLSRGEDSPHLAMHAGEVEQAWWEVWRTHPQQGAWEARTLEALIGGGGHDPYLLGPGTLTRRAAAQEPLLILRTPPWALRHAPILRITLTVLRSLLAASRVEVAYAWRGSLLRTDMLNKCQMQRSATPANTNHDEHSRLEHQASVGPVVLATPADGPGVSVLQEAIVAKCLLAHAANHVTSLEARQECCLFLQDLVLANSRLLPLLVHRGLRPVEVSALLDGVPSALTLRTALPSLIRSCSLVNHARALCFLVEFARRYSQHGDDIFVSSRQALLTVLSRLSPTQMQVCLSEGEDVMTSLLAITQAALALVLIYPAMRPQLAQAITKVLQAKDLDPTTRQSSMFQEALGLLEALFNKIQGPLENITPLQPS